MMKPDTLKSSLLTGAGFGLLAGTAYLLLSESQPFFTSIGLPVWWDSLSRFFALAASTWGAFLFIDKMHSRLPGRFLYHLFAGLALTVVTAVTTSFYSFCVIKIALPIPPGMFTGHSTSQLVVGMYSISFLSAFVVSIVLSTLSCIRECTTVDFEESEFV